MEKAGKLNLQIWDIAWPAILSNSSIPILGLVDAAILGHLGTTQYLGAVAIGGAILSFLYWGFSFLRMGTTGLVAKAVGAGDRTGAMLVLSQSSLLALAIALLVFVLHPLWLDAGIALMAPREQLGELARSYASIRIYSAPAVLTTYACIGWFIGNRDTRWPLLVVVTTNVCNIALDFLFILGLQMASDGAALATVISEYLGCALAFYGVWRQLPGRPDSTFYQALRSWGAYQNLLTSSRHLIVRTSCLLFSFAFFTAMGEKLGPDILAANTLLIQLIMLGAYGIDGFAYAAEALTGNRIGARDLKGFYAAVKLCARWSAGTAVLVSLTFLLLRQPLFSALTDLSAVQDILVQYQWWLIALPLIAAPSYILDGIFIGTAETRYMMYTMLFSTLCVYLPTWYLTTSWGNQGLWLAFALFNGARGLTLQLCYWQLSRTNRWLPRKLNTTGVTIP
ncbi:MAG: MATE family multidrug resistance protein [Halioglobus sp.]|jgi:MATE family multidrug resistance protein